MDQTMAVVASKSESGVPSESVNALVPSSIDEPNLLLLLAGRNEVQYVEVDGWTRSSHVGFPGLRSDLKMKMPPTVSEANAFLALGDELEEMGENLRGLSTSDSDEFTSLKTPIAVQVIAKKVPSIVMVVPARGRMSEKMQNEPHRSSQICRDVYVIGHFLVADATGACIVTCWNEANAVLHDRVQVGDRLIINKGTYRHAPVENMKFRAPFYSSLVDLEIKIEKYSIRAVTHIPVAMMEPRGRIRLPKYLFNGAMKLFTPAELMNEYRMSFKQLHSPRNDTEGSRLNTNKKYDGQFFDTLGIVCYAGRIQRYESYNGRANSLKNPSIVEKLKGSDDVEGEREEIHVKQYVACRWIQLVDETSNPLLVKVYLNNATKGVQDDLVPGALITITHCELKDGMGISSYVQTSVFSEVFVNGGFMNYLRVMPHSYAVSSLPKLSLEICKRILARNDVDWSAGGVLPMRILNPDQFQIMYHQMKNEGKMRVPRGKTFARREGFTSVFLCKVHGVSKVTLQTSSSHVADVVYGNETPIVPANALGYHTLNCYRSCLCHRCDLQQWYSSRRDLTPAHLVAASYTTTLLNELVGRHSKICGPLLLPAKYWSVPNNEIPPLGKLPKVDGEPFYRVGLVDEENRQRINAIYKGYPIAEMESKLKEAGTGREIIALLEFFCSDVAGTNGLEIVLLDFVFRTAQN